MISVERLKHDIDTLKCFTSTPGKGVTRFSFTEEDKAARSYIIEIMKAAGLDVTIHPSGNIIGKLAGANPSLKPVMIGSHYDSVACGGAYDGIYGVIAAIETVRSFQDEGFIPVRTIEVIAFWEEEGAHFRKGLLGSSLMVGITTAEELSKLFDDRMESLYDAMTAAELYPERIESSVLKPGTLKAYVELHIEQGPILEACSKDIGAVTGIDSMTFGQITVWGRADHAGTTPMEHRKDALRTAVSIMNELYALADSIGDGIRLTIGNVNVKPGSGNIVPDEVSFLIDFRCSDNVLTHRTDSEIRRVVKKYNASGIKCEYGLFLEKPVIEMTPTIVDTICDSCNRYNLSYMSIGSGAGHDAMNMADICPVGMIFIPSIGGRSHCPEESSSDEALYNGAVVLMDTVKTLTSQ
jgi:allantoate deiminase